MLAFFSITDSGPRSENETTYYDITEIFEMGKMASLFFNKTGRIAFYLCLTIYLYGDLAIYGAAVAKSLRFVNGDIQVWKVRKLDDNRISIRILVASFSIRTFKWILSS